MISEPELVGGGGFERPEVLTEAPPPRPPRAHRPWLWALGGAVLASAVWGGGLYAYERGKPAGPDLKGYRHVEDLCEVVRFEALAEALGKRRESGSSPVTNEPAISETSCSVAFGPQEGGQSVDITYTLHKVVDPGPEFEARAQQSGLLVKVDGIGEQAFFDDMEKEGGRLRVLDGPAEFQVDIFSQDYTMDGEEISSSIDLSGIEVPMTQDVLALMAELKK
ncbi:hypothetical protein ACFUGD_21515 [Streptomyces sp. NPDC057217]|uniref:hypothetical protein n=1 Tax=Streptomyces sp. NPDC057217 TaxID=3346054 RepID=UPI003627774A